MSAELDDDDQTQIPKSENPNLAQPQSLDSSKTLTLETPDSPPPQSPPHSVDDEDGVHATAGIRRGGGGGKRKKQKRRPAAERKLQERLKYLSDNMQAVVFVPAKRLDFASHEAFLRRVGLWDFVNLEFDSSVRVDLVAQLIASYSPEKRCSYVNGFRIGVNRADLARALKLPTRREKGSVQVDGAEDQEESEDSVRFLEDFVSNWILLHGDAWIMPDEILNWIRMIKEGHFEKVDWAGMIWFMVEKELGAQQLTDCYYTSHLQQLIKFQRVALFEEGPSLEADVKDGVDVKEEEEEEDDDGGADVKMGEAEDLQVPPEVEEKNIGLSLGQENVDMERGEKDDVMDFDASKGGESGHWLINGKNDVGRHFMQPCGEVEASNAGAEINNLGVINDVDDEYNIEEENLETHGVDGDDEGDEEAGSDEEVEEQDGEFQIMQKSDGLEGLSSGNLIQAMEAQNAFSSGVHFRDNLSNDFMLPRVDSDAAAGSSIFGDNGKRHASHVVDMSHHSLNGSNKRPRIDEPADFHMCMEQIQNWVGKARMTYEAKEQAFTHANMQQQALISEIQQRDAVIAQIHKARIEEQQKNQAQVHGYEQELNMMVDLLDSYRKALKETRRAFADYRSHCPLPEDEPLYRDVTGSGGLVLSTMELEKQRIKLEEEERMMRFFVENNINTFETYWLERLQGYSDILDQVDNKFVGLDHEVHLLKERFTKRKVEASECRALEVSEFVGTEHYQSKVAEVAEHSTSPEAAESNAPAEALECNAPAEAVECNAPAEAVECNALAEAVECSNPPQDVEFSAPPQDVEFNAPAEDMECNAPAENVERSATLTEDMEGSAAPTEDIEASAAAQNMECSAAAQNMECSAKEVQDINSIEEQS